MLKNNILNISFFFVVILLFALYENAEMISIVSYKLDLASGAVSYRYSFLMLLLCAVFSFFHLRPKTHLFSIFSILLLCIWFISMYHLTDGNINKYVVLSAQILLPLFVYYYFFYVAQTIDNRIFYVGILLLSIILFQGFISTYQQQLINAVTDEVRTGSLYIYLFLLPLLLLSGNQIIRWGSLVLVAVAMVFSLKRGGIVSFSIAFFVYYIVNSITAGKKIKYREIFIMLCILVIIFLIITQFFDRYADELFLRIKSISEDGGSARDRVYEVTWKMILNSDSSSLLLGHGWNTVVKNSPMSLSAHNDFMEVIYDFGLFVFVFYVYFFYIIYKTMFNLIRRHSRLAGPFAFSVITFTVNSTIAHILIYPNNLIVFAAVWGYILGKDKRNQILVKMKK